MRRYEPWEDEIIASRYNIDGPSELSKLLPRSIEGIIYRAGLLGVRVAPTPWTMREDQVLRQHHPDYRKILRLLPARTKYAAYARCLYLGLGHLKPWKRSEEEVIRKLSATHSDAEMARMLGRTVYAVEARRRIVGILRRGKPKVPVVPLLSDIVAEATMRGVKVHTLSRALGCRVVKPSQTRASMNMSSIARIVEVFGGELYAEWDD